MNRFKRAIKRGLLYLICGHALSWLVAWSLSLMPHWVEPGRYSHSQFSTTSQGVSDKAVTYFIYDSRWFGVWEQQFSTQRIVRLGFGAGANPSPSAQLWWAWEPLEPVGSTTRTYHSLQAQFAPLASSALEQGLPDEMFYSEIKYGWPALSHRGQGAFNRSLINHDGSFESQTQGMIALPIVGSSGMSKFAIWPYRPVWRGLLINTLWWGLVIAIGASIVRAHLHARRMHKGLCPICKYNLLFDLRHGCPECGWRKATHPHTEKHK